MLGAGSDYADGRGGFDTVRYDRNGVEQGVSVNLASGQASGIWDGDEFDHTLVNIEAVRGSNFNDVLIASNSDSSLDGRDGDDFLLGGAGNDELRGRGGRDILVGNGGDDFYNISSGENAVVFSSGNDYVFGFDINTDSIVWDGDALTYLNTLTLNEYVVDGDTRVRFDFTDAQGNSFGLDLESTDLATANQIRADAEDEANIFIGTDGRDDINGTADDDIIMLLSNSGQGDIANASSGTDTYLFTHAGSLGWYGINYGGATSNGITANLDMNVGENFISKGQAGTDELIDVFEAAKGFFFLTGTAGNDVYNIVGHASEETDLEIAYASGSDTINFTATQGSFRAKMNDNVDVVVDFSPLDSGGAGTLTTANGDSFVLNVTGSLIDTALNSWTGNGNDTFTGNNFNNNVILGGGTDTADGRGGYDTIRYNRSEIDFGVTVNLEAGTASGSYDGQAFSHSLSNFERVRGSDFGDQLTAADTGRSDLQGRGGDDLLIRSDFAEDFTDGDNGRDTLLQSNSGSFDFSSINVRDHYEQIEVLSFENNGADTAILSLDNVLDFSNTADSLLEGFFGSDADNSITVLGDSGDRLEFSEGGFARSGSVSDGEGRTLDVYEYASGGNILAIVAVDQDVTVDAPAA